MEIFQIICSAYMMTLATVAVIKVCTIEKPKEAKQRKELNVIKKRQKKKSETEVKETEKERAIRMMLENINNYDGTGANQKKI